MHKFFCLSFNILGDKITIDDEEQAHHIKNVLRLQPGEVVGMFDELCNEYDCRIEGVSDKKIDFVVLERHLAPPKDELVKITVACAIPKNVKMDDIVDKLTQLGVDRIIPLETERTVVKIDKAKKSLRIDRWRRIAKSAAQQSKRNGIPKIDSVKSMEEALIEAKDFDLKLIPTLEGDRNTLREVLSSVKAKNILLFIGPEGDFNEEEIKRAKESGCIPVSLGSLVLRVDTAAVSAVSFIKLYENR